MMGPNGGTWKKELAVFVAITISIHFCTGIYALWIHKCADEQNITLYLMWGSVIYPFINNFFWIITILSFDLFLSPNCDFLQMRAHVHLFEMCQWVSSRWRQVSFMPSTNSWGGPSIFHTVKRKLKGHEEEKKLRSGKDLRELNLCSGSPKVLIYSVQ